MPNYKEIARLKAAGQSNRAVAEALGLARNTVNAAVARIEDSGLLFYRILLEKQIKNIKNNLYICNQCTLMSELQIPLRR